MNNFWDRLILRWRKRQQMVDLTVLWPAFCEHAPNLEMARRVFRAHMQADPAYRHMTDAERDAFAAQLPAPTP